MTSFPVLERLSVEDYGLYPGTSRQPGLDVTFQPGLTLVLGANGLGKTTLVNLLYRMCAGPYDISGLQDGGELGGRSLQARKVPLAQRRMFAARVTDGAREAQATLTIRLGEVRITTTRALDSLELLALCVDDEDLAPSDERYQALVLKHAGLSSYGDWILLLRHITFYFEDRRALVWDPSAQRHILRLLFLPPDTARSWTVRERDVMALDSRARNLRAVLTREEEELRASHAGVAEGASIRRALTRAQRRLAGHEARLEQLEGKVSELRSEQESARVGALEAERDHDAAYRDLERHQLRAVAAAFPTRDATAQYLLAKLFTKDECLACGAHAQAAADALRARAAGHACAICGSPLDAPQRAPARRTIASAERVLAAKAKHLGSTNKRHDEAKQALDQLVRELDTRTATVAQLRADVDALVASLPEDESELHQRRRELGVLRGRVELMNRELDTLRGEFARFIRDVNREIAKRKEQVQDRFDELASEFLLEDCELLWAMHKERVGQSGERVNFPGFELRIGGTDFPSPVRRTGPQQVSESQREFIDLAFRMSLMAVASQGRGTLVIDAPESSLDAVFVTRAADVLTRFAQPQLGNRLVVTSNLVEGALIPELARQARITSQNDSRVVDLLKLAAPTTATRELHREYTNVRRQLFARARGRAT